jgi:hypothetical protein
MHETRVACRVHIRVQPAAHPLCSGCTTIITQPHQRDTGHMWYSRLVTRLGMHVPGMPYRTSSWSHIHNAAKQGRHDLSTMPQGCRRTGAQGCGVHAQLPPAPHTHTAHTLACQKPSASAPPHASLAASPSLAEPAGPAATLQGTRHTRHTLKGTPCWVHGAPASWHVRGHSDACCQDDRLAWCVANLHAAYPPHMLTAGAWHGYTTPAQHQAPAAALLRLLYEQPDLCRGLSCLQPRQNPEVSYLSRPYQQPAAVEACA